MIPRFLGNRQLEVSALSTNGPESSLPYEATTLGPNMLAGEAASWLRSDLRTRTWAVKRLMDVLLASAALIVLSPVLLMVSLAVMRDSPGPVLFRQTRIGRNGQPFVMLKFRTMIAERRKRTVGLSDGVGERRRVHKSRRDPRITRFGHFLRRSCLDELPQLWNVLRGDMSLVGPRPELPEIVARYQPWQHSRHLVAPGITGWWQVNRDGVRLMHEATELDLYYIEHWSLGLDLLILARTLSIVLRGVGAF
jgi:lipopolysaccharide/colanic/teichoic acid biosynthesis glycosyltransferase